MYREIVLLMGMPRSGTSWLSQIFDSSPEVCFRLSPLFSYEFKNQANISSSKAEWEEIFTGAYSSQNKFMSQAQRRTDGDYPKFQSKTTSPPVLVIKDTRFHNLTGCLLKQFENIKVIALVRNPCGAINSWLKSPGEFPFWAKPLDEWRSGNCRKNAIGEYWGFKDWMDVTLQHLEFEKLFPERVMVQRYEELVRNVERSTQRMFSFCNLPLGMQTKNFLAHSQETHSDNEYSVFKNPSVIDSWKAELDERIKNQILSEIKGTQLEKFLY